MRRRPLDDLRPDGFGRARVLVQRQLGHRHPDPMNGDEKADGRAGGAEHESAVSDAGEGNGVRALRLVRLTLTHVDALTKTAPPSRGNTLSGTEDHGDLFNIRLFLAR
jgi:hypothetical protein